MFKFNFSKYIILFVSNNYADRCRLCLFCSAQPSHLAQHRHLTTITSQLQTNIRIAPNFIYKRRCHFNDFQENNRIGISYYIEDASEDIEQFQFLDEGLLTPNFNNLIVIIFLTVE